MKSEWFKDWFNSSEYLDVYRHRNEDDANNLINLIIKNVDIKPEASVLDMACGAGRHSIILARKNFNLTAFDLSENLLSIGKKNAEKENLSIKFIQSDIREFDSENKFDLVLNLFTSFGYFETDAENFLIFSKAYNLLNENGYFVLDYFSSEFLKNNLKDFSEELVNGEKIIQRRKIENSRVVKKIEIIKDEKILEYTESVKMYSKDELTYELNKIGFDIYKTFGDFLGNDFDSKNSPRLIIICKK